MNKQQIIVGLGLIALGYFIFKEDEDEQFLEGGVGDETEEEDLDPEELKKGIKVELEHTKNKKIAKEIATDHLTEDGKYYTKLAKIHKNPSKSRKEIWNKIKKSSTKYDLIPSKMNKKSNKLISSIFKERETKRKKK